MSTKTVALNDVHDALRAKMVEFAGWRLPIDYGSAIREVQAVRIAAGIFDVSHMGRLTLEGESSLAALQMLMTNDLAGMDDGRCRYTLMCRPSGGVIDDLIVCRASAERYHLVVNASNHEKDLAWIAEHLPSSVTMTDNTPQTSMLALQGPNAVAIMAAAGSPEAGQIGRFRFATGRIGQTEVTLARTGYTGEDGFEIICPDESAREVWAALMTAGADHGLTPCGLAARDVLRIEAALPLYGHEIDEDTNPVEAGLTRWVKPGKGQFIGREPIVRALRDGTRRKLVGVKMTVRAVPRAGDAVKSDAGEGIVTSGTYSPTLAAGIAMTYMSPEATEGVPVEIAVHGKPQPGKVCELPFYLRGRATGDKQ